MCADWNIPEKGVKWLDMISPEEGPEVSQALYMALCELTFGPHIGEYRERLGKSLKALPAEQRAEVLRPLLLELLCYETSRIPVSQRECA